MKNSKQKVAVIAGVSLLVMAVISIVGYGVIHGGLFAEDDAASTYQNLMDNAALLNTEILIWLIILVLDVIVAWALYCFFKDTNKNLSLLSGWFRLIYSCILGMSIARLVSVSVIVNNINLLSAFDAEQLSAQIMIHSITFTKVWEIGLIVFGLHLFLVGMLSYRSAYVPNWLSILIFIASIGYIATNALNSFVPQFDGVTQIIEMVMMIPMTLGELLLGVWLIVKGRKA